MSENSIVLRQLAVGLGHSRGFADEVRERTALWLARYVYVRATTIGWSLFAVGLSVGCFLRCWHLNALGYNSDEAVYSGQAAAIADVPDLKPFFPIFRAHPLLFQTLDSIGYQFGAGDLFGRLLAAAFGIGTVALVFATGKLLYGMKTAAIATVFIALMPYDVLVSRQVLLDGPTTFFATLSLFLLALYAKSRVPAWLYAASASLGLAVLSKETSILIVGAVYAFFALTPHLETRAREVGIALVGLAAVAAIFPLTPAFAGNSKAGQHYLAYQLFRRPNHGWTFYIATVPVAMGLLVVLAAVAGLFLLRRESSGRETLLLAWIVVPALFFQLYPVKGFQYLLPTAPAVALLAGRTLGRWSPPRQLFGRASALRWLVPAATALVALSLAVSSWHRLQPSSSGVFLAGSGGIPGGRELGRWIRANVPEGAQLLAIGPSMANIVEFYGHRRAYGLSVGTNPLRRNPAYDPLTNPDLAIRTNDVQYLVWDAFSSARTPFFSNKLLAYKRRYHGRTVRVESIALKTRQGALVRRPLIVVYAVRP